MTSFRSTTLDPIALAAAALFGFGVVLNAVLTVGAVMSGELVRVAVHGFLTLIFTVLTGGWAAAAYARLTIDSRGASRAGPLGWRVDRDALTSTGRIESMRKRHYLVVPSDTRSLSATGLPLARTTYAVPLDPRLVERVRGLLGAPEGR